MDFKRECTKAYFYMIDILLRDTCKNAAGKNITFKYLYICVPYTKPIKSRYYLYSSLDKATLFIDDISEHNREYNISWTFQQMAIMCNFFMSKILFII